MAAPAHVIRSGGLAVWRDVCLRGTGFPARLLLETAARASVPLIDEALAAERAGGKPAADARARIEAAFAEDWTRCGELLRACVREPRFREAVLWQNPGAVHGAMASLLRKPAGAVDSKTREYERLVASYLQRYCAKNDTIGFFGPVGWGTIDDQQAGARLVPGPALVDRRTVYFEHWAIDALAARLSADRELRVHVAPRRMPTVWLDGDVLHHPVDRTSRLPPAAVRLLEACDGDTPARAIAERLVVDAADDFESADEVYDLLDELVESHIVLWRLEVPTAGFHPERALRDAIAAIGDEPSRRAAEAALDELERVRAEVAAAAGDPDALGAAMRGLDDAFVRLTDTEANRNAGKTYAGRRTVYEDCHRGYELVLGRTFLDKLAPALELVQVSARWFTHQIATGFAAVFDRVYDEQAREVGAPDVDFIRFYTALQPHMTGTAGRLSETVTAARAELQRRWSDVLALPAGARRVELRVADLAPRVRAAFDAPAPGWPSARHQSPDLMIAATGPDALERGELLVILGELHAGFNTVTLPVLAKEHPDPQRLHDARAADVGRRIAMVEPRANTRRASSYSLARDALDVEFGDARSHRPRDQVLDVAGFVVTRTARGLVARRRDGSRELELVELLEADMVAESFNFDLLAPAAHRPRVTVGELVLIRERWRVEPAALAFARLAAPLDRFIAARRWAAELAIPRFSFVKAPSEPKPMYLDLDSPVYVEILCKLARTGEPITITEMLPTFDQLWLTDADGARYCSELRMCVVDDAS